LTLELIINFYPKTHRDFTMKTSKFFVALLLSVFIITGSLYSQNETKKLNLIPVPKKVELLKGEFRLDSLFTISLEGKPSERICGGATRVLRRISGRTGFFFKQDFLKADMNVQNPSMRIITERTGQVKLNEDESYTLEVAPSGIVLKAATDIGALRGVETLCQLLEKDKNGYFFPSVKIEDAPRFPWRGLMFDVARHFIPVDVLMRNIDAMASVKFNVFHWHLSEDQGFRVESKTFPLLTEKGSDGLFYTQDEIKSIIKYADERGISVIPEFDIPGHSTAWFAAYPEYASAPGPYSIERKWGVFDPTFNPADENTYRFFDAFFKEMAALFPSEYVHIGGDENSGKQWNANAQIQEFMKKNNIPDNHSLQAYFNGRILEILTKYNKKMIGWDEILHPQMPKNIIIQSWRGVKSLDDASAKGYQVMLSNGYYIDLCFPAVDHYLNDPIPATLKLSDEQKKLILGGEATMWAELISPETVDSRVWPRSAAIAERFWSPADVKDVEDMYRRLKSVSLLLEDFGITNLKNREMLIRRMIGYADQSPIITFLGAVEPVKEYARHHQGKAYTSYSPLTRLVDIAVPDAEGARVFRNITSDYLKGDKSRADEMISYLTTLKDNHKKVFELMENNLILKEIEPLAISLNEISAIGLEAINMLKENRKADAGWVAKSLETVKKATTPSGQIEIMITSPIELLVKEAGK
jgi:hexosaminidase